MYMVSRLYFILEISVGLVLTPPLRDCTPSIYCTDERNVPPLNRIGDPDDILASVRVENGKVRS